MAKIAIKFAKENDNFVVLGGSLPEKKIDLVEVKQLASLPSLDELRAKILGLINTLGKYRKSRKYTRN